MYKLLTGRFPSRVCLASLRPRACPWTLVCLLICFFDCAYCAWTGGYLRWQTWWKLGWQSSDEEDPWAPEDGKEPLAIGKYVWSKCESPKLSNSANRKDQHQQPIFIKNPRLWGQDSGRYCFGSGRVLASGPFASWHALPGLHYHKATSATARNLF